MILGTAAYTDVDFLDDVVAAYGDRVVVSVDVRGGRVASAGWTETDGDGGGRRDRAPAAARRQARSSTRASTATGCSTAPTSTRCARVAEAVRGRFIYSGGIGDARATSRRSRELRQVNLTGVIVGKALYERRFTSPRRSSRSTGT